jgi:hypothetical protein
VGITKIANACSVNVTGTGTHSVCISYASCNATCCTAQDCGGSNPTDCGTYPSCGDTTCCQLPNYTSCTGTTTGCTGLNSVGCAAMGACCSWSGTPASCHSVSCSGMSKTNCEACSGCTPHGTCPVRLCSALGTGPCSTCGCPIQQDCLNKSCATLATTNPLLCSGCNTCGGTYTVDTYVNLASYWTIRTTYFATSISPAISFDETHLLQIG